jgi:hypothetical protein
MSKLTKSAEELKVLIPQSLGSIYNYSDIEDLKVDIIENGLLNPILLSVDGIPLDGYRRITAALEIPGFENLEVLGTNLETTKANRVALNNHREKSWEDKRNEYMIAFETFGKKQGQKDPLVEYNRYDEINKRTKGKFKDRKTLTDLEWILERDIAPYPMSKWVFANNSPVSPIKKLMDLNELDKQAYGKIIQKVLNFEVTPSAAMKEIELIRTLQGEKNNTFTFPESNGLEQKIHKGDMEDLLMKLNDDDVSIVFFECDKYNSSKENLETYAHKNALKVKPFTEKRMKETGSLMVYTKEVYQNGFASRFPNLLIDKIEKETGMRYKQTFHLNQSNSFSAAEPKKVLNDTMTHLLWFVKSDSFTKFNDTGFVIDKSELEDVKTSSFVYRSCSNFIDNQQYVDLIKSGLAKKSESIEKGDKSVLAINNASAFLPITLSSKAGDLVVDLTMVNDIGSLSVALNRRYIGSSINQGVVAKTKQKIAAAITARTGITLPPSLVAPSKKMHAKANPTKKVKEAV